MTFPPPTEKPSDHLPSYQPVYPLDLFMFAILTMAGVKKHPPLDFFFSRYEILGNFFLQKCSSSSMADRFVDGNRKEMAVKCFFFCILSSVFYYSMVNWKERID